MDKLMNWRPTMPRVDIPEFTRCCFCVPLRYGLLIWGYLKMVVLSLLAYLLISDLVRISRPYPMLVIITLVVFTDIVFNTLFLVAGHMKHQLLFQVYYYYSLGLLCFYAVFIVVVIFWNWYGLYYLSVGFMLRITLEMITTFLPIIIIQGYVTLLVRTEVRKLANNSNFEFINNAAEATCSLDMNDANSRPDDAQLTY